VNEPNEVMIPAIAIKAEAEYVLGFPVLIAVILRNETADTDYLDLPELGVLFPIDSVAVEIEAVGGGPAVLLGPSFEFREQALFRTELMAGAGTRMLIDLSQFGQPFKPGRYTLKLSIFERARVSRTSSPVNVEFLEPSAPERAEAARLRRLGLSANAVDSGSWRPFLTSNWNTVSVSPSVGAIASRQLALHLALHRAAYGPEPLALIPVDTFRKLQGAVLSAEAALLEYEIVAAHGDRVEIDRVRSGILGAWPDLRLRLAAIDRGEGLLRTLRTGYGVERARPLPGTRPYTLPHKD
jgi:hypothetical protein